jgi:hypothetical protein
LVGRVFPEGENREEKGYSSILGQDDTDLLMVNAIPSTNGTGIVFQLREISGKEMEFNPDLFFNLNPDSNWTEVNVVGEHLNDINGKVLFKPNSVHFLKVSWNKQIK